MSDSEREAVRRKAAEEYRQRQEQARLEHETRFARKVEEARRKGQECLRRWGEYTVRKSELAKLIRQENLDWSGMHEINRICLQTEKKAAKKAAGVDDVDGGMDWPDDVVVEALKFLTEADDDRASGRTIWGGLHPILLRVIGAWRCSGMTVKRLLRLGARSWVDIAGSFEKRELTFRRDGETWRLVLSESYELPGPSTPSFHRLHRRSAGEVVRVWSSGRPKILSR